MMHEFRVYGEVRGQGRPRIHPSGRWLYKPKKDVEYEAKIKREYIDSGGQHFGKRPLAMLVISHRSLPNSRPKKVSSEPDIVKPDASNILKAVEDALNGIAYDDDRQIVLPIPLKTPRTRLEKDYIDVLITDEFDDEELEAKVRRLLCD